MTSSALTRCVPPSCECRPVTWVPLSLDLPERPEHWREQSKEPVMFPRIYRLSNTLLKGPVFQGWRFQSPCFKMSGAIKVQSWEFAQRNFQVVMECQLPASQALPGFHEVADVSEQISALLLRCLWPRSLSRTMSTVCFCFCFCFWFLLWDNCGTCDGG